MITMARVSFLPCMVHVTSLSLIVLPFIPVPLSFCPFNPSHLSHDFHPSPITPHALSPTTSNDNQPQRHPFLSPPPPFLALTTNTHIIRLVRKPTCKPVVTLSSSSCLASYTIDTSNNKGMLFIYPKFDLSLERTYHVVSSMTLWSTRPYGLLSHCIGCRHRHRLLYLQQQPSNRDICIWGEPDLLPPGFCPMVHFKRIHVSCTGWVCDRFVY